MLEGLELRYASCHGESAPLYVGTIEGYLYVLHSTVGRNMVLVLYPLVHS